MTWACALPGLWLKFFELSLRTLADSFADDFLLVLEMGQGA